MAQSNNQRRKMKTTNTTRQITNRSIIHVIPRILLCPLLLLLSMGIGRSTDVPPGTIVDHWTLCGSPYRVLGNILVADLTIDPGVTIYFANNYVFEVGGNLAANGSPSAPIVFTSTNGTVGWQGIYFNASGVGSVLNWCRIQNSVNAGIRVQDSSPIISNCIITNNTHVGNGGGIWVQNSTYDLELDHCSVVNNQSKGDNTNTKGHGGGIFANMGTGWLRLVGTIVSGNSTQPQASDQLAGGGLYVIGNALLESNSIVMGNIDAADYDVHLTSDGGIAKGGGVFCSSGTTILRNTLINSNFTSSVGGHNRYTYGSGVYLNSGQLLATNSIISYNSGDYLPASAIYINGGTGVLVNCAVAYNSTEGLNLAGGTATALNAIFFYNSWNGTSYGTQIVGAANVTYCDVQNGFTGTSNINFSPLFATSSDLRIITGSRCIDAGSTNLIYNDVSSPPSRGTVRNDIGAHGGPGAGGWYWTPVIVVPPVHKYAVTNTSVSISAGACGGYPLGYQWYCNGTLLSSQTGSSLNFASAQLTNQGSYYIVVTNAYGAATSAPVVLTVTTNGAAIQDISMYACLNNMYAGLNILGWPQHSYVLSYTTDVGPSPVWTPLATNFMTAPNWFYVDMDSPFQPRRFYRVELK
jgi:hypothetical protein